MSWRISQHYGFGAASVELAAEPHFVAHHSLRLWPSMRYAGRDFYTSTLPPLMMAALMVLALFVTVSQDKGYTDLEVVMIQDELLEVAEETPEPEALVPEPVPEPVVPEPEPPKPLRVAEKKPEPPPPVKPIVKKPEPPPPPVKRIARQQPKPPPQPRVTPKAKPLPKPAFQALAVQPPPPAPPAPTRRGNRVREQVAAKPKVDLAPLAGAPKLVDETEANRARRFAAVRASAPSSRPRADLGPPIAARALDAPAPAAPPARSRRAAPRSEAERRVAKVSFAAAAPAPVPAPGSSPAARRSRTAPRPEPSRQRSAPPPLALAAAAPTAPRSDLPAASMRSADRERTERNEAQRSRSDHSGGRDLAGVPLASLKACVSDSEEDALKRRLLAAAKTQRECVSRAGTYRFVETKNLNAFLMTIERAAGRPVADRCAELEYALACVSR